MRGPLTELEVALVLGVAFFVTIGSALALRYKAPPYLIFAGSVLAGIILLAVLRAVPVGVPGTLLGGLITHVLGNRRR